MNNPLKNIKNPVKGVKNPLKGIKSPIKRAAKAPKAEKAPRKPLANPLKKMNNPLKNLNNPLKGVKSPLKGVKNPLKGKVKSPIKGKGPSLKSPDFASDLYRDLRDRHLLPLVGVLLVGLVAVPFLLSSDPGVETSPTKPAPEASSGGTLAAVTPAPGGLRLPSKRFEGEGKSPFVQQYSTPPVSESTDAASSSVGSVSTPSPAPAVTTPSGGGSDTPPIDLPDITGGDDDGDDDSEGSFGNGDDDPITYFYYRPVVRFGVAGSESGLHTYKDIPIGTTLPRREPVAIFLGITDSAKRAMFSLSDSITDVRDGGSCFGGKQSCTMLTLKVGEGATLIDDAQGRTYRIALQKINLIRKADIPEGEKPPASAGRQGSGSPESRAAEALGWG